MAATARRKGAGGKSTRKPRRTLRTRSASKRASPGPTSTFSPRLLAIRRRLDAELRRLFPQVEAGMEYGMRAWKVRRPREVAWTKGTLDPNILLVGIVERKQGIVLHLWNPYDPSCLQRHKARLATHGLKAMVGCLQYSRKGEYPVDAVVPILEEIAVRMHEERGTAE